MIAARVLGVVVLHLDGVLKTDAFALLVGHIALFIRTEGLH